MSNVIPFDFQGMNVRVIEMDGEPWFVGKDVALALGYSNPQKALRDHCKALISIGVNATFTLDPQTKIIPERDVYRLIMKSKLPSAERFEEWVVGEVLPSIRKTGSYQAPVTREQQLAQAVMLANEVMEEQKALIEEQSKKIEEDSPKVGFYEAVTQTPDTFDMAKVAKILNVRGLGRNNLISWLRTHGIFRPNSTEPYQRYVTSGHFKVVTVYTNSHSYPKTVAFQKGVDLIYRELVKVGRIK